MRRMNEAAMVMVLMLVMIIMVVSATTPGFLVGNGGMGYWDYCRGR